MKVVALDTYQRLKIKDAERKEFVPEGTVFEVSEERAKVLLGDNGFRVPFVKVYEEPKEVEDKPKKRGKKKKE